MMGVTWSDKQPTVKEHSASHIHTVTPFASVPSDDTRTVLLRPFILLLSSFLVDTCVMYEWDGLRMRCCTFCSYAKYKTRPSQMQKSQEIPQVVAISCLASLALVIWELGVTTAQQRSQKNWQPFHMRWMKDCDGNGCSFNNLKQRMQSTLMSTDMNVNLAWFGWIK